MHITGGREKNPPGRVVAEDSTGEGINLMKCKEIVNVSTLNTRFIRRKYKREELAYKAASFKIDILGIQEHGIIHEEKY